MKRLIKHNDQYNNISIEYGRPGGILFPQYDEKIENDNINSVTYNSNLQNGWDFEKNIDYPEWNLQK